MVFKVWSISSAQPHKHDVFSCCFLDATAREDFIGIGINDEFSHHDWVIAGTSTPEYLAKEDSNPFDLWLNWQLWPYDGVESNILDPSAGLIDSGHIFENNFVMNFLSGFGHEKHLP